MHKARKKYTITVGQEIRYYFCTHTPRNVSVMNELKLYPSNDIISREDTFLSHDKISAKVFALQNTFEQ